MRTMQHGLEAARRPQVSDAAKPANNRCTTADDCFSTRSLRDWLERERAQLENAGHRI